MAALVIPNCVLVRLVWTLGGTPYAVNVLGARAGTPPNVTQAMADALGAAIKAALASSGMGGGLDTAIALANVGVRSIHAPSQPEFLDGNAPHPGTEAVGKLLPPQIAMCVTLRTALAGGKFRGRVYLPGWTTETLTETGTVAPSAATWGAAFVTAIGGALSGQSLTHVVLSRLALSGAPVTQVQVRDTIWDTIRKRAIPGI